MTLNKVCFMIIVVVVPEKFLQGTNHIQLSFLSQRNVLSINDLFQYLNTSFETIGNITKVSGFFSMLQNHVGLVYTSVRVER